MRNSNDQWNLHHKISWSCLVCFSTHGICIGCSSMIQLVPRIPQRDSQRSTARFIDVGLNATTAGKIPG